MPTDTIIQLLTQRFDQLDKRLDVMDAKNDQRDMRVNTMDAENKKRLDALEADVGFVKNLFKGACALIATAASGFGIWKGLR
jgi:tetrahydromethanopterin S-methyltransferase subunit G